MANQMLAKGVRKPKLTIEQSINRFYLNPKLSDVCFLVGDERERIIAHRFLLAAESEVFESMFYGELQETNEIAVPDLSPIGFRNMIKYFYTKKAEEIDFSEVYPTYMAANKYLAFSLIQDLTDHITANCLKVSNACVIYDQLLKLKIDDSLITDVKIKIAAEFLAACASDSFKQIDEDTLVSILKFKLLNIAELNLLEACIRWTDSEVARRNSAAVQASKRTIFEPIKHLIRFGDLSLSDFGSIPDLNNYLTMEEIAAIFLHLSHRNVLLQVDFQSPREPCKVQVAKGIIDGHVRKDYLSRYELRLSIRVDKKVLISSIKTSKARYYPDLKVDVYKDNQGASSCRVTAACAADQRGNFKIFTIDLSPISEPSYVYDLQLVFSNPNRGSFNLETSMEMSLRAGEGGPVFKIDCDFGNLDSHCIDSIEFCGPFD